MPEPQNHDQPIDADSAAENASTAREQAARDHDDVLAALVGDDHDTRPRTEPETADPAVARPAAVSGAQDAAGEEVQYGVGPFSIREVSLGGVWLVAFVISFFSILPADRTMTTVWTEGINWILTIAVPTIAVFLLVLRRLSPDGIRRVGSLGIDQFASVAFSVSAVVWIGLVWQSVALSMRYPGSNSYYSWVVWTEAVLMVAGVVLTVFAPLIPVFSQDFEGRPERPAHRLARPVRPVSARPRPVRPAPVVAEPAVSQPTAQPTAAAQPAPAAQPTVVAPEARPEPEPESEAATTVHEIFSAEAETRAVPTATQAFWALVPEVRDVVDASGTPLFSVGPTAWALVIEERGDVFVVRHEDGRVGYLRDVSGVTRG